jgi:hypothetical protein
MFEGLVFLQSFVYGGGEQFGNIIDSLAQMGFFSYILPFLLIFALVYGILLKVKIFEKNAISGIIALAVALMAIQFDAVPIFFSQIFPRLGIGIGIILVLLILIGLFMPNQAWIGYVLFGVSALIFLVILFQSAGSSSGVLNWLLNNWPLLVGLIFVIVVIVLITSGKNKPPQPTASAVFPLLYPQKP